MSFGKCDQMVIVRNKIVTLHWRRLQVSTQWPTLQAVMLIWTAQSGID
jgi:hypothetical protein